MISSYVLSFSIPEIFRNAKGFGSSTNFFGTVGQKKFYKSDTPLRIKFSDNAIFPKQHQKDLTNFFCDMNSLWYPLNGVRKFWRPTDGQRQKLSKTPETFRKTKRASS